MSQRLWCSPENPGQWRSTNRRTTPQSSMTRILPLNSLKPRASDQSPIATESTSPAEVIPSTTAASKSAFEEIWKKSAASHSTNGHVAKNPANERNRAVAAFSREPVSAPQALRQRALRDARPAARRQPRKCPPTTEIKARRTTSRAQAGERRLPQSPRPTSPKLSIATSSLSGSATPAAPPSERRQNRAPR